MEVEWEAKHVRNVNVYIQITYIYVHICTNKHLPAKSHMLLAYIHIFPRALVCLLCCTDYLKR